MQIVNIIQLEMYAYGAGLQSFHGAIRTLDPSGGSSVMPSGGVRDTDPLFLLSFCKLSFVMTCAQDIIIGGFCSVDCSFDTGHVKMEW